MEFFCDKSNVGLIFFVIFAMAIAALIMFHDKTFRYRRKGFTWEKSYKLNLRIINNYSNTYNKLFHFYRVLLSILIAIFIALVLYTPSFQS